MKGGSSNHLATWVKWCTAKYQLWGPETSGCHFHGLLRRNGAMNSWFTVFNGEKKIRWGGYFLYKTDISMEFPYFSELFVFFFQGGRWGQTTNCFRRKIPCFENKLYPNNVWSHHRCISFRKECVRISCCSAILRLPVLRSHPTYKKTCADTASFLQQSPHQKTKLNKKAQIF